MNELSGFRKRKLEVIAIFLGIIILSGCSKSEDITGNNGGDTGGKGPGPNEVFIDNFTFNPSTITVAVNTTVKWTNNDGVIHTVTSNTGAFDSGSLGLKSTFSFTFNATGTYSYFCTPHPNMIGTVVVTQ